MSIAAPLRPYRHCPCATLLNDRLRSAFERAPAPVNIMAVVHNSSLSLPFTYCLYTQPHREAGAETAPTGRCAPFQLLLQGCGPCPHLVAGVEDAPHIVRAQVAAQRPAGLLPQQGTKVRRGLCNAPHSGVVR